MMSATAELYFESQRLRPTTTRVQRIWERLNADSRARRYSAAKHTEQKVKDIQELICEGIYESSAVQRISPPVHRSTYRHWATRYATFGIEGLIDCRFPEPRDTIPKSIELTILELLEQDPSLSVDGLIAFIAAHHQRTISSSSVKRILRNAGQQRAVGRPSTPAHPEDEGGRLLSLGGMKLLEAAATTTGYLENLTKAVIDHISSLAVPEQAKGPDVGHRDENGRFLSSYNERYTKCEGDAVAPGFASVSVQRAFKDPSLFHVQGASPQVVERKLWALLCSPLIGGGRWDGMRSPRGELLGELCGYAYMPATLSLFTNELKYAGASTTLWETHARTWHSETQDWGSPRHAAVVYVDGTSKPIFTNLFSECTKVSLFNRAMPGLDVIGFHNGYGVPLLYLAHSGRAPLVKAVPAAIDGLEKIIGAEIARIVVIDAEGNSAPFLWGLQEQDRAWVTRLRPGMVQGKAITNWTAFRPYRENDRVREGELDLKRGKNDVLRVRVVEVERRESGKLVHLAASKLLRIQDWKTDEVADLYFSRWPNQELNFRAVKQATGLNQVRGYGKRLVQNIAVTTKIEETANKLQRAEQRHAKQIQSLDKIQQRHADTVTTVSTCIEAKDVIDGHIDAHLAADVLDATVLRGFQKQRKKTETTLAKAQDKEQRVQTQIENIQALAERTQERVLSYNTLQHKLESKRTILAHDVELDSIFNVLKVGLTLLITYVLRNMLDNARMAPLTFLERVATLPAWFVVKGEYEYLTFKRNPRDPKTMAILAANCSAINAQKFRMRSGRILQVAVQDPKAEKPKKASSS